MNDEGLLVEAIKAGHTQRFEELVDIYKDKVYNMARYMTGCQQEAQDLAQEIFILIYRNIHGFQGNSSLSTWIHRIALNRCLDWQRKQQRRRKILLPVFKREDDNFEDPLERQPNRQPTPEESLVRKEQIQELREAIQQLPEKYKKVMILYYYQQLSYSEISEILDLPVRTIETHLYRARQKIREHLSDPKGKGVKNHGYA
ncbi:MAG TPA: RNA polymerase sigma factor [Clostridiales bacterium]|nr:RNA polymerase sigma factor [Clostridiales bacterium]